MKYTLLFFFYFGVVVSFAQQTEKPRGNIEFFAEKCGNFVDIQLTSTVETTVQLTLKTIQEIKLDTIVVHLRPNVTFRYMYDVNNHDFNRAVYTFNPVSNDDLLVARIELDSGEESEQFVKTSLYRRRKWDKQVVDVMRPEGLQYPSIQTIKKSSKI